MLVTMLFTGIVTMHLSADADGWRQLVFVTPRKQPCLHGVVRNVVTGNNIGVGFPEFRKQKLLIGDEGLHGVRDEPVGASTGALGQSGQPLLDLRLEADA